MKISYAHLPKPHGKEIKIIAAIDCILVFGWLIAQTAEQTKLSIILGILATGVTAGFVTFLSMHQRSEKKALHRFFTENAAEKLSEDEMWEAVPPCFGHLADRQDIVSAIVKDGYLFPLTHSLYSKTFLLEYVKQHGNRHVTYLYTISVIEQERLFPHLFLDGKQNGAAYMYSGSQTHKLEGEFNKYFTLYVPDDSKIDALTVLTPDVMQEILHDSRPYDLEFMGNSITFVANGSLYDRAKLPLLFGAQKKLEAELNDGASGSGSLNIETALRSQLKPWELTTPQWIALSVVGLVAVVVSFYL